MKKKAIILLSAGIDSTTAAAIAKAEGFDIYTIFFHYGQKNKIEFYLSKKNSEIFKSKKHLVIKTQLDKIGGSALNSDVAVPKNKFRKNKSIPVTYVPARNTIFLSYAAAWAEFIGAFDIFYGANTVDFSGYPDCRPQYVKAFEKALNLGTKQAEENRKFKIHAPLINMSKKNIILKGLSLGVDYSKTTSCYEPLDKNTACGKCDSCLIRKKAFLQAGISDPIKYYE